jgi:hypothetical protein
MIPTKFASLLLPYQIAPANQLFRALQQGTKEWGYPGAIDLSDVGVGKTFMDLAAALATGRQVGVLCPTVGTSGWERVFKIFGQEPAFIDTYEAVRGGFRPHIARKVSDNFHWANRDKIALILDESQILRNADSLTSACVSGLIEANIPTICASATMAISPVELFCAGQITGLHKGDADWERWLRHQGASWDYQDERWRWKPNAEIMHNIHSTLIPERGCRVRKADTGERPESSIRVLPIKVPEGASIEAEWRAISDKLDKLEQYGTPRPVILNQRRALRTAIWKRCELALVPFIAERIKVDLDTGNSCVAFLSFTDSRIRLGKLLGTHDGFYGGQSPIQRRKLQDAFQANRIRVLLNNIAAGGASVSLQDLTGEYPRISYIFPTDNPVKMGQAPGRIDRQGGKTPTIQWIPCVAGSLSERMVGATAKKMLQLNALNDGFSASNPHALR